jgi:hypothetical protein
MIIIWKWRQYIYIRAIKCHQLSEVFTPRQCMHGAPAWDYWSRVEPIEKVLNRLIRLACINLQKVHGHTATSCCFWFCTREGSFVREGVVLQTCAASFRIGYVQGWTYNYPSQTTPTITKYLSVLTFTNFDHSCY